MPALFRPLRGILAIRSAFDRRFMVRDSTAAHGPWSEAPTTPFRPAAPVFRSAPRLQTSSAELPDRGRPRREFAPLRHGLEIWRPKIGSDASRFPSFVILQKRTGPCSGPTP